MSVEKLSMAQINQIPVLLGERDILKTISLLPGVKSQGEGNTGFFYVAKKNTRTMTEKFSIKKYDPVLRKHVIFKEGKIK